jgi:hypothetical protein
MKKIILLISLVLSLNAFSQKLVKTYWDWSKKKLQAEFYTDAYGTRNGTFKGYSEYGGLLMQGVLKDNLPVGKWIENYTNGKLHFIKFHDTPGYSSMDVKDGKIISYYENGKTIKYERNFKNGELDGVWKVFDENGVLIEEDSYINGESEKRRKRIESEKIEYDLKEKERKEKENAQNYKNYVSFAENYLIKKNYNEAKRYFLMASELSSDKTYFIDKIKEINAGIEKTAHAKAKFDLQVKQIDSLYNEFKNQYVVYKQSFWVDPVTLKPIMKETYPKGENIYKKSNAILSTLLIDYKTILDGETEIIKGNYILSILDKMNSLTYTKDLEKQIKNAQSDEEVKTILGI